MGHSSGPKLLLPFGQDQQRQPHNLHVHEPLPVQSHGEAPQQLSFLASQPQLVQRHLALMEQELQLQKQLTCVTMERAKVMDNQGNIRASEQELKVQRALGLVQKERAMLEAETADLEAAAMRRQKEMVQMALRLEREMEEVVKHREMVILTKEREYEARKLKDLVENRVGAVHQDSLSLGGGTVGVEAEAIAHRRGMQGDETLDRGLVFGDLERNRQMIPRPAVENAKCFLGSSNPVAAEVCNEGDMVQEVKVIQTPAVKQESRPAPTGREKP